MRTDPYGQCSTEKLECWLGEQRFDETKPQCRDSSGQRVKSNTFQSTFTLGLGLESVPHSHHLQHMAGGDAA